MSFLNFPDQVLTMNGEKCEFVFHRISSHTWFSKYEEENTNYIAFVNELFISVELKTKDPNSTYLSRDISLK